MVNKYSWTEFYIAFADKLRAFQTNRSALTEIVKNAHKNTGVKIPKLENGEIVDIDPFTVFALFNKGLKDKNRTDIATEFAKLLDISIAPPTDFSGIPVVNAQKAAFYCFIGEREENDIDNLWSFFIAALDYAKTKSQKTKEEFIRLFDVVEKQKGIKWNLTMGLYWIRPFDFISLDSVNREFMAKTEAAKNKQIPNLAAGNAKCPDGEDYLRINEILKEEFSNSEQKNFPNFSYTAWLTSKNDDEVNLCWYVGAVMESGDQCERFIKEGIWEKDFSEKRADIVNSIEVGDKIAIKATFTQKNDLPFDANGKHVSAMRIKAYGTVTENPQDGKSLKVKWDKTFDDSKVWFFFTLQKTIWKVERVETDWKYGALLDFTFKGEKQDYNLFLKDSYWERLYGLTDTGYAKYIELLKANHNIVLTGAPGTGKTFLAKKIAEEMGAEVGFVQFHPSYDYTDFVEGLRPTKSGGFDRTDGVFKTFCKKALKNLQDSEKTKEEISVEQRLERGFRLFAEGVQNGEISSISLRTEGMKMDVIDISEQNVVKLRPQIEGATRTYDVSLRRLTKLSNYFKTIEALNAISNINDAVRDVIGGCNSSAYWGMLLQIYKLLKSDNGKRTEEISLKPHIYIIDEINRGEISKIFGELFFSIDPGYRGEKGKVQTQYQNLIPEDDEFYDGFFVPENIYIIGTMNDIDRSVESMDFAMRRRFVWEEITAEDSAKNMGIEGEELERMTRLNEQIERTDGLSKDYQLGGAYFLEPMSAEDRWNLRIKSLLKEYLRGIDLDGTKLEALKKAYDMPVAEEVMS